MVSIVLVESLLLWGTEAEALGHARVPLEEGASGQAPGHPLDRYHVAFLGDEGRR